VARGTQHRKRRPGANARGPTAAVTTGAAAKPRKRKPPQWQEQLFFQRLRTHAKIVYVALAITFVLGFVLLGVGSGSTGVSDALQNAFNFGSRGGTSISSLKSKTDKHPSDPKAWRDLATAYEQKQKTELAVQALLHYTALRPKDQDALGELASQYSTLASTYQTQAQQAQLEAQNLSTTGFAPPSTTPLGKAYADPTALQDPISQSVSTVENKKVSDAFTKLTNTEKKALATYKQLAKLDPTNATTQIQLGQAALNASNTAVAVAAFKRFLKLAPADPLAAQVRAELKTLQPVAKRAKTKAR
jgi:cytochrome c-type biogenesis protein CcmH/NrfG